MRGLFKRLGDMLAPTDRYPEEPERDRPAPPVSQSEPYDAEEAARPDEAAWDSEGLPEISVERYRELFRYGPIGVWYGWDDDPEVGGETVTFYANHTGVTLVTGPEERPEEKCLFEWQMLGEQTIRMRYVAWLTCVEEDGTETDEWTDSEAPDAEDEGDEGADGAEEPKLGEWETVEYDFRLVEEDGEADIVMYRVGHEGFPCSCRYDESALAVDWEAMQASKEDEPDSSNQ